MTFVLELHRDDWDEERNCNRLYSPSPLPSFTLLLLLLLSLEP